MAGMLTPKISVTKSRGFSLVEVLVALFLQAFGMLGMTALQIKALKSTQAALIDSQVQFLLVDMAERLRSNPGAAYVISFMDDTPVAINDCEVVICSSSELVLWDISQWRSKIEDAAYLPEGEGQISFNNLTQIYDISIRYTWSQMGVVELIGTKRTASLVTRALD
jgi:type IV pilus modification protein PilV